MDFDHLVIVRLQNPMIKDLVIEDNGPRDLNPILQDLNLALIF